MAAAAPASIVRVRRFTPSITPRSDVARLLAHGYTPLDVPTFVVYAPPG